MPQLDPTSLHQSIQGLAIRNESVFRKAALVVTHTGAAELLGITKSTQSDWCNDHLTRACQVFAAYGLKLVPRNEETFSVAKITALRTLAREALDAEGPVTDFGNDVQ